MEETNITNNTNQPTETPVTSESNLIPLKPNNIYKYLFIISIIVLLIVIIFFIFILNIKNNKTTSTQQKTNNTSQINPTTIPTIVVSQITPTKNTTVISYKTYSVGDEVEVYLSGSNTGKFNVIADNGSTITLFYQGALAGSTYYKSDTCYYVFDTYYNVNCKNEYNSSTVKTSLKSATLTWSNPTEIRLITLDELLRLGTWTKTSLSGGGIFVYISSSDVPKWILGSTNPVLEKGYWVSNADTENVLNDGFKQAWSVMNIAYENGGIMPRIGGSLVQDTLYMRPIITISKQYIK